MTHKTLCTDSTACQPRFYAKDDFHRYVYTLLVAATIDEEKMEDSFHHTKRFQAPLLVFV